MANRNGALDHVSLPSDPGRMIAPELHARQHRVTRHANRSELTEDYVELIADLIETKREARVTDIAHRMGVKPATVGKMIARLRREGLVVSEPYRSVFLTEKGERMAAASRRRHAVVLRFLRAIGVGEATAMADAEGMEHHVSEETLAAMARLADQIERAGA